MQFW